MIEYVVSIDFEPTEGHCFSDCEPAISEVTKQLEDMGLTVELAAWSTVWVFYLKVSGFKSLSTAEKAESFILEQLKKEKTVRVKHNPKETEEKNEKE